LAFANNKPFSQALPFVALLKKNYFVLQFMLHIFKKFKKCYKSFYGIHILPIRNSPSTPSEKTGFAGHPAWSLFYLQAPYSGKAADFSGEQKKPLKIRGLFVYQERGSNPHDLGITGF
jgi:hypothetical protein